MYAFSFSTCLKEQKYSCLPVCKDCKNPLECTSCNEDRGFILNEATRICECSEGYLQTEEFLCKKFESYVVCDTIEKGYQVFQPTVICQYGYFLYSEECF